MAERSTEELASCIDDVRQSPEDGGNVTMIVRRPEREAREILEAAELDIVTGLVGDTWIERESSRTADGTAHPEMQLTLINTRFAAFFAGDRDQRALAGDQLHVDLDLSGRNVPAGTRLAIGSAVVEVTAQPHTGCAKFAQRFGMDTARFVNSEVGRELNLRGINAKVVVAGTIRTGDTITKVH